MNGESYRLTQSKLRRRRQKAEAAVDLTPGKSPRRGPKIYRPLRIDTIGEGA
jgi:hypothetical protein